MTDKERLSATMDTVAQGDPPPEAAMPYDDPEEPHWADDEDACWMCGGLGVLEDECTCGEDTCCCLEPEPPICPECGGNA